MKRVVITGLGIVSCIGTTAAEVVDSLKNGRSGIKKSEDFQKVGMRSQVCGSIDLKLEDLIERKVLRFMGKAAAYSYLAMKQAIEDSGLTEDQISNQPPVKNMVSALRSIGWHI